MNINPKFLFQIFLVLAVFICNAQTSANKNIAGNWQGVLKQEDGKGSKNFAYWMTLTLKGDSLFGIARTEVANTEYYATINIRGIVKNNTIIFIEDKLIDNHPRPGYGWCLFKGRLLYNEVENSISGNWVPNESNCEPGSLLLNKSTKEINTSETVRNTYSEFDVVKNMLQKKESINGYKVILKKVNFQSNSYKIINKANEDVIALYELLKQFDVVKVNIQGHSDNVGDDDANAKLSYLRAKEIADILVAKGIDKGRITYEGYGKSRPIANNESEGGKAQNRRVEVEFLVTDKK